MLIADCLPSAGKASGLWRLGENDFFDPEDVARILRRIGISTMEILRKDLWYLVSARR